ncbi:MAG: 4Fe-4S binding protein [Oscillospiraceae bacterium]|nr:4Fe-4S binding protein [Oscillospiraceae bacterium]
MTGNVNYLQLKTSNCRNCYKCIRHCPVKSIKFSGNQAHILQNDCILCGTCYVVCPQNAKQIKNDVDTVKSVIADGKKVIASLAPSFAANYGVGLTAMTNALKKLGFHSAEETSIGAEIVKKQYEKILAEGTVDVLISSCCHTVNTLIQKYYPDQLAHLAHVLSPMQAHCKRIKEENPDAYTVFIGPCISKKEEADKYKEHVDTVLTYGELSGWLKEAGVALENCPDEKEHNRSALFPTTGGIVRSMDKESLPYSFITVDGMENCMKTLEDIRNGDIKGCFVEMSACAGSCIGGPVMENEKPEPVRNFLAIDRYAGKNDTVANVPSAEEIKKEFAVESGFKDYPSDAQIKEILMKMGKTTPEHELNCGSCGYNTCREKAVAVYQGKADFTMCLPYLKEKAESFSDNIINNTPNGILVLNEDFEVQLINKAACNMMNIKNQSDVLGCPVIRILNPTEYMNVLDNNRNVYEKKTYLAEYQLYVEETIIYDRNYHIIMSIMRDITGEEKRRVKKENTNMQAVEITDKVIDKQMRVVQEIASLLGETTAETKIALTKLKETLADE